MKTTRKIISQDGIAETVEEVSPEEKYRLLLHSLKHPHNSSNIERHALLLNKWCRDYSNGLYLRDLENVCDILLVLKERLLNHSELFYPVLQNVLKLCSKPLLEIKSNERLRPRNQDQIVMLYCTISSLWTNEFAADITDCFRRIINEGRDPNALKSDVVKWSSDGSTVQIMDRAFVLNLLHKSHVIDFLISKFNESVEEYIDAQEEYNIAVSSQDAGSPNVLHHVDSFNDTDAEVWPIIEIKKKKMHSCRSTVDALLEFCLDLSSDDKSASQMFYAGICNGCISMLKDISSSRGPRNPRITELVQLCWISLENSRNVNSDIKLPDEETELIFDVGYGILVLKDLLTLLLDEGYRLIDKECRNEVMIVLSLILTIFPDEAIPHVLVSGLIDLVVSLACIGEVSSDQWLYFTPNLKIRNFSTASETDLEFKRLLWQFLSQAMMTQDNDVLLCIASSPMLEVVLMYLEYDPTYEVNETNNALSTSSTTPAVSVVLQRNSYQSSSHVIIKNQSNISSHNSSMMSLENSFNYNQTSASKLSVIQEDEFKDSQVVSDSKIPRCHAHPFLSTLPISQLRQFQILSSNFLVWHGSNLVNEFIRINGPSRLLTVIERLAHSFDNYDLIYYCLLIFSRCTLKSNIVKDYLISNNTIYTLVLLFDSFHRYNISRNSPEIDQMNVQCVRLISALCQNNLEGQAQFQTHHGIEIVIKSLSLYAKDKKPLVGIPSKALESMTNNTGGVVAAAAIMKVTSKSDTSQGGNTTNGSSACSRDVNLLIVALVDCIRESIVGNSTNETVFALNEGIDALLDVLEGLNYLMRVQTYRVISDIMNNPKFLVFFKAWKSSKTLRSSAQIFCHGWLDEEIRLGSKREDGILANLWEPLDNQTWPNDISIDFRRESLSSGSPSVETMPITVTRLNNALATAKSLLNTVLQSNPQLQHFEEQENFIYQQILKTDCRSIIASILNKMDIQTSSPFFNNSSYDIHSLHASFDRSSLSLTTNNLELSCQDRQVIAAAKKYHYYVVSECWDVVADTVIMSKDGVMLTPIDEDIDMINAQKNQAFSHILISQMEQMALDQEQVNIDIEKANTLHNHILDMKNQQIKSEWLKKNAKRKQYNGQKLPQDISAEQ